MKFQNEKENFRQILKGFASSLVDHVSRNGEWTIKGFIDVFKNVYTISNDTKIVSKILELHVFPLFLNFAEKKRIYFGIGDMSELVSRSDFYIEIRSRDQICCRFENDLQIDSRILQWIHIGFAWRIFYQPRK